MLSFYNIWTVAKFEIKTLARSWFFRIFAALSIILLFIVNLTFFTDVTGGWTPRLIYANSGIVPYANLLFFNLAQAIIAIFLASDFLKRDKKLDTTEAIYIRSITNSDYILGKSLGILLIFTLLNIAILFVAAIMNLLNTTIEFNILAYVYYPLLISLPTLIFIIGITFLLMTLMRVQAIVFILLLGIHRYNSILSGQRILSCARLYRMVYPNDLFRFHRFWRFWQSAASSRSIFSYGTQLYFYYSLPF